MAVKSPFIELFNIITAYLLYNYNFIGGVQLLHMGQQEIILGKIPNVGRRYKNDR